jgi:cytochrome c oxidase assembly protein subunit 15
MFSEKTFNKLAFLNISAVFILFFLGGLVRSTGAGMGCPDWPKCFGQLMPPTTEDQLPANYQEMYLEMRKEKVYRLTGLLHRIGWHEKAEQIKNDPVIFEKHEFNLVKAYTEHINRLFGALTGLVSVLLLVSSFQFKKTDRVRWLLVVGGVLFIFFNAFLGAMVVSTNLLPGLVTAHFITAFLSITAFMLARFRKMEIPRLPSIQKMPFTSLFLMMAVLLIQIVFGTQVRESIDGLVGSATFELSKYTYGELGASFLLHRMSSFLLLLLTGYTLYVVFTHNDLRDVMGKPLIYFVLGILIQIISGSANTLFNLPDLAQVVHITVGSLMFGIILYICMVAIKAYRAYMIRA